MQNLIEEGQVKNFSSGQGDEITGPSHAAYNSTFIIHTLKFVGSMNSCRLKKNSLTMNYRLYFGKADHKIAYVFGWRINFIVADMLIKIMCHTKCHPIALFCPRLTLLPAP